MGQYHILANLDHKEYVDPHQLGDGLKLLEWSLEGGMFEAMQALLAGGNGFGGGDLRTDHPFVGRWCGDRVGIYGDYAPDNGKVYEDAFSGTDGWTDISVPVKNMLISMYPEGILTYTGEGWMNKHFDIEKLYR